LNRARTNSVAGLVVTVCLVGSVFGACGAGSSSSVSASPHASNQAASVVTDRCNQRSLPSMPPSTGSGTPSGFTTEMLDAVLAPASSASTLASAYIQFNGMKCTEYTHHFRESPPDFFYYDCVGFTGYTVRVSDPLAWRSVMAVVGLHSYRVVPTPMAFTTFFGGLTATPQPGWQSVTSIQDIRPGDVLAWQPAYSDGSPDSQGVGHSVLPLVAPRAIPGSNGQRWEVVVMDSTAGGHGPDDTRKPGNPLSQRNAPIRTKKGAMEPSGLGIGTIALDTTPSGAVTGVEWNVGNAPESIVFGAGRPLAGNVPTTSQ
jgi:hypothetical protein